MKERSIRWYVGGLLGVLIGVICFELIWLPAPFVMSARLEWIEVINWLYYTLLFIPGCFIVGAYYAWREAGASPASASSQALITAKAAAIFIVVSSILLAALLIQPLQHIQPAIVAGIAALLGIVVSLYRAMGKRKATVLLISYAVIIGLLLCPTGYKVTYPAMTMNMNSYAQLAVEERSDENGWIDGVLVFDRPAFPVDWLYSKMFPQYLLEEQTENEPSIRETYAEVVQMKNDANLLAAAIAWEQADKGEAIIYDGVAVVAIVEGSPADGALHAGDRIVAVNDRTIRTRDELLVYMNSHVTAGSTVSIEVQREGQKKLLHVGTMESADEAKRPILGIAVQDAYHIELELDVALRSYISHFGGPSHGAMLTLALYDQLVDEDITNGLHIAGTGTIEVDGSIGMVGGIPQKAYAVGRTEADVFFVPAAAYEAAKAAAPQLNIVAVERFHDILSWLEQHAE